MSSKAYLRRASINEAQLMSEMRSFSKNKAMERNLVQKNEMMDKHLRSRKKNQDQEKYELNKSLEKTVKTMSTDEYLERSLSKYTSMRERERERLERRYSNKQRAFYRDFKQLELEKYGIAVPDIYREVREDEVEKARLEKARLAKAEQEQARAQVAEDQPDADEKTKEETGADTESDYSSDDETADTIGDITTKNVLMRQNRRATVAAIPKKDRPVLTNRRYDRRPSLSDMPYI